MKTCEWVRMVDVPVVARRTAATTHYNYMAHSEFTVQCASLPAVITLMC